MQYLQVLPQSDVIVFKYRSTFMKALFRKEQLKSKYLEFLFGFFPPGKMNFKSLP